MQNMHAAYSTLVNCQVVLARSSISNAFRGRNKFRLWIELYIF